MQTVVMERLYDEPLLDPAMDAVNARIGPCLEINDVKHLHTLASADRRRFICAFEARDVETVRRAMQSAGVEFQAMWAATWF